MELVVTRKRPDSDVGFRDTVFLVPTNWDDWGKFQTESLVYYKDARHNVHELGSVKIGQIGLRPARAGSTTPGSRSPELKSGLMGALPSSLFSLGQDETYYESIVKLGLDVSTIYFRIMNDIAFDLALFDRVQDEAVTQESLLRSVATLTVTQQFHRIAHGGTRLTPFSFEVGLRGSEGSSTGNAFSLSFYVEPDSTPPTNIHVLIGRNGVGKTTLLSHIASDFRAGADWLTGQFSSCVSVSFSAFDKFETGNPRNSSNYHHVGLREGVVPQEQFTQSLRHCLRLEANRRRLRSAFERLEADPFLAGSRLWAEIEAGSPDEQGRLFESLSSGHKLVLLTMSKLVEAVSEKTLVLLDEPEAHLHPPLLSAFVRALSGLLVNRNGMAIVATHSPVVLQEVPQQCVWKLRRSGSEAAADRPAIETFGENVGTLTDEVFGLEVTATGYHTILVEAAHRHHTYEAALRSLNGQLGAEGRAILRALTAGQHVVM